MTFWSPNWPTTTETKEQPAVLVLRANWQQPPHFTSMIQTSGSMPSSSTDTLACFITHSWMASVMWGTTDDRVEPKSFGRGPQAWRTQVTPPTLLTLHRFAQVVSLPLLADD